MRRWRGLVQLVQDAVEHGSRAVERVQLATADRTFRVLEHIPILARPAHAVRLVHDTSVALTHGAVRAVGKGAGDAIDAVLAAVEAPGPESAPGGNAADPPA